jgi:hypothetical protein
LCLAAAIGVLFAGRGSKRGLVPQPG